MYTYSMWTNVYSTRCYFPVGLPYSASISGGQTRVHVLHKSAWSDYHPQSQKSQKCRADILSLSDCFQTAQCRGKLARLGETIAADRHAAVTWVAHIAACCCSIRGLQSCWRAVWVWEKAREEAWSSSLTSLGGCKYLQESLVHWS